MKNRRFLPGLLSIVVIVHGCNLQKELSVEKSKSLLAQKQYSTGRALQENALNLKRILWQWDTADNHYTVTISPLDSFTYSTDYGFSGRATKVKIEGHQRKGRIRNDSSATSFISLDSQQTTVTQSLRQKQNQSSRLKEKENKPEWRIVLVVAMVLAVAWYLLKIRNK